MSKPITPFQPGVTVEAASGKQSAAIQDLRRCFNATKGVQLPRVKAWQDPNKVAVQSHSYVRKLRA